MNYILFDGPVRKKLLPFTFTRPVAEIRFGILTMREKWELLLDSSVSVDTEMYLSEKYPAIVQDQYIMINAAIVPSKKMVEEVNSLSENQALYEEEILIAYFVSGDTDVDLDDFEAIQFSDEKILIIENVWDIFSKNHLAITLDFESSANIITIKYTMSN